MLGLFPGGMPPERRSKDSPSQPRHYNNANNNNSHWMSHVGDMLEPVGVHHNIDSEDTCEVEYVFGRPGHGTLFALDMALDQPPPPTSSPHQHQQHMNRSPDRDRDGGTSTVAASNFALTPAIVRITASGITVASPASSFSLFCGVFTSDGLFLDEDSAAKHVTGFPTAFTIVTVSQPVRRITLTATPDSKSQDVLWSLKQRFDSERNRMLHHSIRHDEDEDPSSSDFAPQEGGGGGASPSGMNYKTDATWSAIDKAVKGQHFFGHHHQQSNVGATNNTGSSTAATGQPQHEVKIVNLERFNMTQGYERERKHRNVSLAFAAFDDVIQRSSALADEDDGDASPRLARQHRSISEQQQHHHHHHNSTIGSQQQTTAVDAVAAAIARRNVKHPRQSPTDYYPLQSVPVPGASAMHDSMRSPNQQRHVIGPAHALSQLLDGDGLSPARPQPIANLAPPSMMLQRSSSNLSAEQNRKFEQLSEEFHKSERVVSTMKAEMDKMREQLSHVSSAHGAFPHGSEARQIAERAIKKKNDGSMTLDFESILTPAMSRSAVAGGVSDVASSSRRLGRRASLLTADMRNEVAAASAAASNEGNNNKSADTTNVNSGHKPTTSSAFDKASSNNTPPSSTKSPNVASTFPAATAASTAAAAFSSSSSSSSPSTAAATTTTTTTSVPPPKTAPPPPIVVTETKERKPAVADRHTAGFC